MRGWLPISQPRGGRDVGVGYFGDISEGHGGGSVPRCGSEIRQETIRSNSRMVSIGIYARTYPRVIQRIGREGISLYHGIEFREGKAIRWQGQDFK